MDTIDDLRALMKKRSRESEKAITLPDLCEGCRKYNNYTPPKYCALSLYEWTPDQGMPEKESELYWAVDSCAKVLSQRIDVLS